MSSNGERTLPREADHLLTELWRHVFTGDVHAVTDEEFHACLRRVSRLARAAGLLPEEMIVGLKASWSAHYEFRPVARADALRTILADVISVCIDEFYRDPVARHAARDRSDAASGSTGGGTNTFARRDE